MNDNEMFWERVNAALDERRDPLADEQVHALVAEDPSRLEELLALRERIANLPTARPRRWISQRRVSKAASLAAAVLAVGTAAWFALRDRGQHVASAPAVANAPAIANSPSAASDPHDPRSCVISFEAHVVIEGPNTRSTIDSDGEHVVRSREIFSQATDDDSASRPAFIASIVHLNP
jgi:hypothetical protein